jgi:hypothetical protein
MSMLVLLDNLSDRDITKHMEILEMQYMYILDIVLVRHLQDIQRRLKQQ